MFIRVELSKPFQPLRENTVYCMDRLVDMAKYPLAKALTIYAIADSNVNGSPISIGAVGNDGPDPGSGIVGINVDRPNPTTTPNKYSKLALSIEVAKAPMPFYGVVFRTGPTAPGQGFCWAYADIWWEG